MNYPTIESYLQGNDYPGRGVGLGLTEDGQNAVIVYFIMGRSVNSRNRVFLTHGDGIRTEAYDPSKLTDPSLVIYSPVRVYKTSTITTNGDQTDTVYDFLAEGKSFEDALRTRTFEPDPPILTPRISGISHVKKNGYSYKLSILKSQDNDAETEQKFFYEYHKPVAGVLHLIHTYNGGGDPLTSFQGEPRALKISGDPETMANSIWASLNEDNKVSLFVRMIDLNTGRVQSKIINKNQ